MNALSESRALHAVFCCSELRPLRFMIPYFFRFSFPLRFHLILHLGLGSVLHIQRGVLFISVAESEKGNMKEKEGIEKKSMEIDRF